MDNINNFGLADRFPGQDLDSIEIISERMNSLYSRNKTATHLQSTYIATHAAIEIATALEYHFKNFEEKLSGLPTPSLQHARTDEERRAMDELGYEASAYMSCAGQIYYWTLSYKNSHKIKRLTPKLRQLMPFRHKNAAHLSIHLQREEDTQWARLVQAWAFKFGLWHEGRPIFQTQFPQGNAINFDIQLDHPILMEEIYRVFEAYIKAELEYRKRAKRKSIIGPIKSLLRLG